MARIGVFIPCGDTHGAHGVASEIRHSFGGVRVVKLRDPGPRLRERLAALESRLDSVCRHLPELNRAAADAADKLAALEADFLDHRTRIGDLEREPAPGPRMSDKYERERLFLLRDRAACGCLFADCTKHGAFYYATEADRLEAKAIAAEFAGEPAPVRPEPPPSRIAATLAARRSDPTAHAAPRPSAIPGSVSADPDRLAKVAEPTNEELFEKAQAIWNVTGGLNESLRAIARALYNLGREHGRADADAAIDMLRGDRAALLARAEKAEQELTDLRADLASLSAEMGLPPGMRPAEGELARMLGRDRRAEDIRRGLRIGMHHAGDWVSANATVDAVIAELPTATRPTAPDPIVHVPTESSGADGARPASEQEMAAELHREGWIQIAGTLAWTPLFGRPTNELRNAYAAMRAAKGAK